MSEYSCPNRACAHPEESHALRGGCMTEGCPCGESEILDGRAQLALAGHDWAMTPDEHVRRGFDPPDINPAKVRQVAEIERGLLDLAREAWPSMTAGPPTELVSTRADWTAKADLAQFALASVESREGALKTVARDWMTAPPADPPDLDPAKVVRFETDFDQHEVRTAASVKGCGLDPAKVQTERKLLDSATAEPRMGCPNRTCPHPEDFHTLRGRCTVWSCPCESELPGLGLTHAALAALDAAKSVERRIFGCSFGELEQRVQGLEKEQRSDKAQTQDRSAVPSLNADPARVAGLPSLDADDPLKRDLARECSLALFGQKVRQRAEFTDRVRAHAERAGYTFERSDFGWQVLDGDRIVADRTPGPDGIVVRVKSPPSIAVWAGLTEERMLTMASAWPDQQRMLEISERWRMAFTKRIRAHAERAGYRFDGSPARVMVLDSVDEVALWRVFDGYRVVLLYSDAGPFGYETWPPGRLPWTRLSERRALDAAAAWPDRPELKISVGARARDIVCDQPAPEIAGSAETPAPEVSVGYAPAPLTPAELAARVRAHAKRAGYTFQAGAELPDGLRPYYRWRVLDIISEEQASMGSSGLFGPDNVRVSQAEALALAESWPDGRLDRMAMARRALADARLQVNETRNTSTREHHALSALIRAVDALIPPEK